MNFKELMRFTYGLMMGTSTPYLKPAKRYLFPTSLVKIDDGLSVMLGGSGVCGVLGHGEDALVINTNLGAAAMNWKNAIKDLGVSEKAPLVLNSLVSEYAGAQSILFREASRVYSTETVKEETVLKVAGETVRLIPVGQAATGSDLVVFLETRSLLFLGPLFFNRIHPDLRQGPGFNPEAWLAILNSLALRFHPRMVVPGEGDLTEGSELKVFSGYLQALMNPSVEFSYCRQNYDWAEIPSATSLEENFNILRDKTRSMTTLRG